MLKNILSLLLSRFYSKQENEAVAQQAMPSRSIVALVPTKTSIDLWGVVFEGTAPTNGYASISFTASSDFCIASAQSYEAQTFSSPKVAGDVLRVMCPVAKGRKFILCARNAKNITCEFIETIGGGYQVLKKLILQGGGLCLNSLSSSLRRSSCRVRRNGSGVKQSSQTQTQVPLSKWRTLLPRFTCHRPMDGLRLEETTPHLMLASQARWECVVSIRKDISELQRLSAKVMPLAFIVRRKTSNRWRPNSFPAKGQRNTSLVGGASC